MILKGQKQLRCGYTTGTCAAAAAKAAAIMLLTGKQCQSVYLTLPAGEKAVLEVKDIFVTAESVRCGIVKDAGDDPDITNGMIIYATVSACEEEGIHIDGGEGVGKVTKPGLDQPVGEAAINSVPRKMMREALADVMHEAAYTGGLSVLISIPGGEEKATKTLNPVLGIEGGLSVLGTSGIVEPMSEKALIDTIAVEIRMHRAQNEEILLMAPGNYGLDFLKEQYGIASDEVIKISNYIGDSIDLAVYEGAAGILLAGHIGKLIKLAGGIMNTHSHQADARMEILTAYAAVAGIETFVLQKLMQAVTTDAGLDILKEAGALEAVMQLLIERMHDHLQRRAGKNMQTGIIVFSNVHGILGQTDNAETMLRQIVKKRSMDERLNENTCKE
jgi:cobalt-precorrin-5B (C1)-methyltransferase